jgi:hypothetical protein
MIKHGWAGTSTYHIWLAMRGRCLTESNPAFKDYGERGIAICERWGIFSNFLDDMGERPGKMTLERRNNNKGYSKQNCKWADRFSQNRNSRNTKLTLLKAIEIVEARVPVRKIKIKDLSCMYSVSVDTIYSVLRHETWTEAAWLANRSKYTRRSSFL